MDWTCDGSAHANTFSVGIQINMFPRSPRTTAHLSLAAISKRTYFRRKGPPPVLSLTDAVANVRSYERVYFHGVAAFPVPIAEALASRYKELKGVEVNHLHIEYNNPLSHPDLKDAFFVNNLFVGANQRKPVAEGRASYVPCFLSEIPKLMRTGRLSPDWTFLNLGPPDRHGFCSLGVEVATSLAAAETARNVIGIINPNQPRTHGHSHIHLHCLDGIITEPTAIFPLPTHEPSCPTPEDERIGHHIASLIPDGACLQMGIGGIPDAVLRSLTSHKDLGVHTEMFQDGLIPLVESGVVTGARKNFHRGKIVTSFVMGTKKLYEFVDDNPGVVFLDSAVTNDPIVIMRNPRTIAINSAVEVDLTGQVCADSIGTRQISGVGGQVDFERGAAISEHGIPIICLKSRTKTNESTIVCTLKQGAGVVTTRHHVHWVVTEWGAVNLFGLNMLQRAARLISIAHPEDREQLEKAAFDRFKVDVSRFAGP